MSNNEVLAQENVSLAQQIEQGKIKLIELLKKEIDEEKFLEIANEWTAKHHQPLGGQRLFIRHKQIDTLQLFLQGQAEEKDVLKIPLLFLEKFNSNGTAQDVRKLIDTMVEKNMPLVSSIAWKFYSPGQHLSHGDLIQEGSIGLMTAIEKFDWRRGYKFSTFATSWITQAITRAIKNSGRTIRVPVSYIDKKDTKKTKKKMPYTVSWETAICKSGSNGKEKTLKETFFDNSSEKKLKNKWREQAIEIALKDLLEREKIVIKLRFGLDDGIERTLEEAGAVLGVTRERARQIEKNALKKLGHPKRKKLLQDLL